VLLYGPLPWGREVTMLGRHVPQCGCCRLLLQIHPHSCCTHSGGGCGSGVCRRFAPPLLQQVVGVDSRVW
jgi:hypothetical protein